MGKLYLGDLEVTNYDTVMELSGITTANTKAIQTNATNIADNKTAIEANATNIAANKASIEANTKNIAANSTAIKKNADNITELATKVTANETAIQGKADKASTLKGYGIEDAYTKEDTDTLLDKKADKFDFEEHIADKTIHVTQALLDFINDLDERLKKLEQ